jgi:hypothetical protein
MSKIDKLLDIFFGVGDIDQKVLDSLKRESPPRRLTDGKLTTNDGRDILWLKREVLGRGTLTSNLQEFLNQPRAMEFKRILKQLNDTELAQVYIDADENVIALRKGSSIEILENVDYECEELLFETVLNMHKMRRRAAKIVNNHRL